MSSSKEGRKFVRHTIPVMIEAPTLSEVPLVPEDVRTGGFGVVITKKLEPGNLVPCDIQVLDGMFKGCEAEVMWVRENGTAPPPGRSASRSGCPGRSGRALSKIYRNCSSNFTDLPISLRVPSRHSRPQCPGRCGGPERKYFTSPKGGLL